MSKWKPSCTTSQRPGENADNLAVSTAAQLLGQAIASGASRQVAAAVACALWRSVVDGKTADCHESCAEANVHKETYAHLCLHERINGVVEEKLGAGIGISALCTKLKGGGFAELASAVSSAHRCRRHVAHPQVDFDGRLRQALDMLAMNSPAATEVAEPSSVHSRDGLSEFSTTSDQPSPLDKDVSHASDVDEYFSVVLADGAIQTAGFHDQVPALLAQIKVLEARCQALVGSLPPVFQVHDEGLQVQGGASGPHILIDATSPRDSRPDGPFSQKSQNIDDDNAADAGMTRLEPQSLRSCEPFIRPSAAELVLQAAMAQAAALSDEELSNFIGTKQLR